MGVDILLIKERIPELVKAIMPKGRFISADDVMHGYNNPAFIVHAEDGDYVLRVLNPRSGDWKVKKEQLVYHLFAEAGIPVPEIITIDTSKSLLPYNFAITKRLGGVVFKDVFDSMNQEERMVVYKELGQIMARSIRLLLIVSEMLP